jgi:hypothetical protein
MKVAVLLLLIPMSAQARTSFVATPLPFSCGVVKAAAQVYTIAQLERMAREHAITITQAQRREAYKCLAQK